MKKLPFEIKITLIYIFLGAMWILFSDRLVVSFTSDIRKIQTLSTYKGWFYVLTTGLLFYFLKKKEIKRRNELYHELLEAKKKAEEADRLKSAFLANLSHYIRTPMNSILGFVELLKEKDLSAQKQELFLSYINSQSYHLLQVISSIIEISKIQENQYEINKSLFSLNELLRKIVINANIEIKRLNKPVVVNAPFEMTGQNIELYTDKDIVEQILSNLASNAVNFTPKGEIMIGYNISEKQVEIFVKDTGVGVSEETQKALFKDFLYTSFYTCSEGEGAGLGLHLSSKLAMLIGGELKLKYTNKNGSEFCLYLPLNLRADAN
ncbi:MAG TPA: ATP-binding protein [Bacteroidales bacterium]|nr:ATP-binding protein [Bacteroidales bacterium]